MIGWPTFAPCRKTSITKFGVRCVPNWRLKTSMQPVKVRVTGLKPPGPHDGVAASAESAPVVAKPPTRASVAAPASTLLLKDMDVPFLEPQPYPAHGCCCCHHGSGRTYSGPS